LKLGWSGLKGSGDPEHIFNTARKFLQLLIFECMC
jgi:hypothetical protein